MQYINNNYFKIEIIDGVTLISPRPNLNHMKIEFYLAKLYLNRSSNTWIWTLYYGKNIWY